jgi:hypothetical protein
LKKALLFLCVVVVVCKEHQKLVPS